MQCAGEGDVVDAAELSITGCGDDVRPAFLDFVGDRAAQSEGGVEELA